MRSEGGIMKQQGRLDNLDYLRGLSAACIMLYHYSTWSAGERSAQSFLGRAGIYGVAIFYVLSGLTLAYVYQDKLGTDLRGITAFFKKRFFRIFPLLWLATIISIAISKKPVHLPNVLLNLSGLFGFFKWDTYFATGAWSIGNELVFYTLFPLLIFVFGKKNIYSALLLLLIAAGHLFFAYQVIHSLEPLSAQWRAYANPLNQLFYFAGGLMLCLFFSSRIVNNLIAFLLATLGLALLILMPSQPYVADIVTGTNRVIFTIGCFLLCFGFFKLRFTLPLLVHTPLTWLGRASYSIYLLHPIVYSITKAMANIATRHFLPVTPAILIIASITATIVLSYFTYRYFESYFIRLAHPAR